MIIVTQQDVDRAQQEVDRLKRVLDAQEKKMRAARHKPDARAEEQNGLRSLGFDLDDDSIARNERMISKMRGRKHGPFLPKKCDHCWHIASTGFVRYFDGSPTFWPWKRTPGKIYQAVDVICCRCGAKEDRWVIKDADGLDGAMKETLTDRDIGKEYEAVQFAKQPARTQDT